MTVEHAHGANGHRVDDERLSEQLYAGSPDAPNGRAQRPGPLPRLLVPALVALATVAALRVLAKVRSAR
jgi:hypothetical protein